MQFSNISKNTQQLNRGLFLTRDEPDENELLETARGIVNTQGLPHPVLEPYLEAIVKCYVEVYRKLQPRGRPDFFGLR